MGLVTRVVPSEKVEEIARGYAQEMTRLDVNSLSETKRLIREAMTPGLELANRRECDGLIKRFCDPASMEKMIEFMMRKNQPKL